MGLMRTALLHSAVLVLLSGCAAGRMPVDPVEQGRWYSELALNRAKIGAYDDSMAFVVKALGRPGGHETLLKVFQEDAAIAGKLDRYLSLVVDSGTNKRDITTVGCFLQSISGYEDILQNRQKRDRLHMRLESTNLAGSIAWDLNDNATCLPPLQTEPVQARLLVRSITELGNKDRNPATAQNIADYLRSHRLDGAKDAMLRVALAQSKLSRAELLCFMPWYSDVVSKEVERRTVRVRLSVIPRDRLFEEDLKEGLLESSQDFVVNASGAEGVKGEFAVTVEKHRYEERILPTQTRTVSYPRHEVDMIDALVFMPQFSNYMFDLTTGGMEVEYGYSVKVLMAGNIMSDKLVRGVRQSLFKRCANQRVVNVFGGVSGASFMANRDMRMTCSDASDSTPNARDMREEILRLIVDHIVTLDVIASRIN